jgi:hypothetical protein
MREALKLTWLWLAAVLWCWPVVVAGADDRSSHLAWLYSQEMVEIGQTLTAFRVYRGVGDQCAAMLLGLPSLGNIEIPAFDESGALVLNWRDTSSLPDEATMVCYELSAVATTIDQSQRLESFHSDRAGIARRAKILTWGESVQVN